MLRFEKQAREIVNTLGLASMPIAGKFSDALSESESQQRFSVCGALEFVRRENVMITLSKENCDCAGGRHFIGLQTLPSKALAAVLTGEGHRVYESTSIAEASVSKQPQPIYRGGFFIIGPLDKFETDPDIVLFFANPAQADRILGLATFKGAEPFMHYPATSICSTITNTLAKAKPDINFVSTFERRTGKWSPNELIIALPFKDFLAAVDAISHSGFGTLRTS